MRTFYSCLFYLLIPFIFIRLIWRSIKAPAYRYRWRERFALYDRKFAQHAIWFHAVSVGEAEALFPLARQILQQHPQAKLLITTTTPTGSARVKAVMQDSVDHVYLPYDLPCAVKRFMQCFKPKIAVMMETEIWPNFFAYCGKNAIPLYIINARLSKNSAKGYRKIPALIRPALSRVKLIATQTVDDAERFIAIGAQAETVKVLGNIKFDLEVSTALIKQGAQLKTDVFEHRFVWLIASTHKDEEALFLDIYKKIKPKIPDLILVIAPRHPERFGEVKKLCEAHRLAVAVRTANAVCTAHTDVYLADTMGELKLLYAVADVAFVGGSMVPVGGHNILEALAVGTPVMFGPYMVNFKDISEGVLQRNAAIQCQDNDEISTAILALHADAAYRQALAEKGKAFVQQNQGAITRILNILNQDI
ncbi:MAG: lipid IV(A) 3-deoxy-D-manno-octulosonic acid transferase [Methylococcaceae bacterium]